MDIALGEVYAGVFSVRLTIPSYTIPTHTHPRSQDSDKTWEDLNVAGEIEYDRFWRMPLSEEFGPQIYSSNADLQNVRLLSFHYPPSPSNVSPRLYNRPAAVPEDPAPPPSSSKLSRRAAPATSLPWHGRISTLRV